MLRRFHGAVCISWQKNSGWILPSKQEIDRIQSRHENEQQPSSTLLAVLVFDGGVLSYWDGRTFDLTIIPKAYGFMVDYESQRRTFRQKYINKSLWRLCLQPRSGDVLSGHWQGTGITWEGRILVCYFIEIVNDWMVTQNVAWWNWKPEQWDGQSYQWKIRVEWPWLAPYPCWMFQKCKSTSFYTGDPIRCENITQTVTLLKAKMLELPSCMRRNWLI